MHIFFTEQTPARNELFLVSKEDKRIAFIAGTTAVLPRMTKGRDVWIRCEDKHHNI